MAAELYTTIILDTLTPEQIIKLSRDTALLHSYIKVLDKKIHDYLIDEMKRVIIKNPIEYGEILRDTTADKIIPEPDTNIHIPYTTEVMNL